MLPGGGDRLLHAGRRLTPGASLAGHGVIVGRAHRTNAISLVDCRRARALKGFPRLPYIEVKALDFRFDDEACERVIAELTAGLCVALGEEVRESTWIVVEGVPPKRWGIAGRVSG